MIDSMVKTEMDALAATAWRKRTDPAVHMKARRTTDHGVDRGDKIRLLINELHRLFVYAPDPVKETIGPVQFEGGTMDADDACVLLATLAMSIGIPCRIIAARYRGIWCTCFIAYEDEEGRWVGVDPLRQKTSAVFEELAIGPDPREKP